MKANIFVIMPSIFTNKARVWQAQRGLKSFKNSSKIFKDCDFFSSFQTNFEKFKARDYQGNLKQIFTEQNTEWLKKELETADKIYYWTGLGEYREMKMEFILAKELGKKIIVVKWRF